MTQTLTAIDRVAAAIQERHSLKFIDIALFSEACTQLCLKHAEVPTHIILSELLYGSRKWLLLFFIEFGGQAIEHYPDVNTMYLNIPSSTQVL